MTNKELQEILSEYDDDAPVMYRDFRKLISYIDVDYIEYDLDDEKGQYCVYIN